MDRLMMLETQKKNALEHIRRAHNLAVSSSHPAKEVWWLLVGIYRDAINKLDVKIDTEQLNRI